MTRVTDFVQPCVAVVRPMLAVTLLATLFLAGSSARARAANGMRVWATDDMAKVLRTAGPGSETSVHLYGARNEAVSFQIQVRGEGGGLAGVNTLPGILTGPGGASIGTASYQLYRETYQDVTHPSDPAGRKGFWPDGLIPIGRDPIVGERRNGAPFDVPAGQTQGIWVDLHVPPSQAPGEYRGRVTVTASGVPSIALGVQLTIWRFSIPSQSSLPTAFGYDTWDSYRGHYGSQWDTNKIVNLTNRYSEAALQMRISMYGIDVSAPDYSFNTRTGAVGKLDWSLFDRTALPAANGKLEGNSRRFNALALPVPNNLSDLQHNHNAEDVAFWRAVATHFRTRGWFGRSYLYYDDEPSSKSDFQTAVLHARLLHQADRRFRYILTTHYRPDLVGSVNIWVPIINELDSPGYPRPFAYARRQAAGDSVWWYDSDSSADQGQWPDMFIDHGSVNQRITGWMTWRYHLDGFLYYDTVYAYPRENPWTHVYEFGTNGDGTLFYPGKPSIIGGKTDIPCFSIRLMEIRQGLQDYEYMRLLAAHGRRADADRVVHSVVASSDSFTHDPAVLLRARLTMGRELSSLATT